MIKIDPIISGAPGPGNEIKDVEIITTEAKISEYVF